MSNEIIASKIFVARQRETEREREQEREKEKRQTRERETGPTDTGCTRAAHIERCVLLS